MQTRGRGVVAYLLELNRLQGHSCMMDIESMTRWTSLARVVDPSIRNHRLIIALSALGGAVGFLIGLLFRDSGFVGGLQLGVLCGFGVFFSWVIARELDPDHPNSGLLPPFLVVPAILAIGAPSLVMAFWIVILLRMVNRSTGLPAKPLDSLMLLAMALWLTLTGFPSAGLLTGLVMLVDSALPDSHPYHRYVGAAVAVLGAGYLLFQPLALNPPVQITSLVMTATLGLIFLVAVSLQSSPQAECDFADRQLSKSRVRAGQVAGLALALIFMLLHGANGIQANLPLWAAMAGVGLYGLIAPWLRKPGLPEL
ncbi:MAG: hypothetical protein ACLFWD_01420 [Anaerolineales bacterium]